MTEHNEPYEAPWRNRNHQLYEQYCYEDELPDKLRQIIKVHGKAFDDYWQFFKAAHRKPQRQVIVRRPLWMTVSTTERFADKAKYAKAEQGTL